MTMTITSSGSGLLRKNALGLGVALYASAAIADTVMTLQGVGSDLSLEGIRSYVF